MKNYPKRLLPKQHYKKIKIKDIVDFGYLIHYTETKDIIDENGKLKINVIVRQSDHLRDYSNSLLGIFKLDDIYIEIIFSILDNYFVSAWELGSNVKLPEYGKDFKINNNRGCFFLRIKDFDGFVFDYYDEKNFKAKCKVIHTPTNSNFWHFSIRWFTNDNQDIYTLSKNKQKGEVRRLITSAKALIIEKSIFNEPENIEFDKMIYTT